MGAPKVTFQVFLTRAKEIHGDKFSYDESSFSRMDEDMTIICKHHGKFPQRPKSHIKQKAGCPKCNGVYRNTKEDFIYESKNKFGDLFDYSHVNYVDTETSVDIICPEHGIFPMTPYHHLLSKLGCPYCGRGKQTTDLFIKRAIKVHSNKFDYSKVVYVNNKAPVSIGCKHGVYDVNPREFLRGGIPCPTCNIEYNTNDFVTKAHVVHRQKYKYDKTVYIDSTKKVTIHCSNHGYFEQVAANHLMGQGCPSCQQSKGETFVLSILENHKIQYQKQYKFGNCTNKKIGKGCRKLPFDFYIPNFNTCIEYDGRQHFEPSSFFKGEDALKKQQLLDEIKNQYCEENGIKLIRIPYTMKKKDIEPYILSELGM